MSFPTYRLDAINVVRFFDTATAGCIVFLQNAAKLLQPHL